MFVCVCECNNMWVRAHRVKQTKQYDENRDENANFECSVCKMLFVSCWCLLSFHVVRMPDIFTRYCVCLYLYLCETPVTVDPRMHVKSICLQLVCHILSVY